MQLGEQRYTSNGPLRDLLRVRKQVPDYRIGPMIVSVWELVGGSAPGELEIKIAGSGVRIKSGKTTLDVLDLLKDIQRVLEVHNQTVWMLFDKIDEIHPGDPAQRDRALEGLFPACMAIHRMFPRIIPRVFIRSDLYGPQLRFTNKSHLEGKQFVIEWDAKALQLLLVKRALVQPDVREYVEARVPAVAMRSVEKLSSGDLNAAFHTIFATQPYGGPSEAKMLNWLIDRATDASGNAFPREFISYGNIAKKKQEKLGGAGDESLITGRAVVQAYYDVSRIRCETYLSEFPELEDHVKRFRGKHDAPFSRAELVAMFDGLNPTGDQALEKLHEVGVISPRQRQDVSIAESFDVPRLYRAGLGLQIKARP